MRLLFGLKVVFYHDQDALWFSDVDVLLVKASFTKMVLEVLFFFTPNLKGKIKLIYPIRLFNSIHDTI